MSRVSYTYLIGGGGALKIGRTYGTTTPESRLPMLQTGNPNKLTLLGVLGGGHHERELHRRFARYRLVGEWFQDQPEILAAFGLDA